MLAHASVPGTGGERHIPGKIFKANALRGDWAGGAAAAGAIERGGGGVRRDWSGNSKLAGASGSGAGAGD